MNYIIECQDEAQQIQVLQKLEKEGYSWTSSGAPTNFVPIKTDPRGKIILTKPKMTIAYTIILKDVKKYTKTVINMSQGVNFLVKK